MTNPQDLEAVRALLERKRYELIEQYEAAGVGVGRQDDGYAIVIYLKTEKHRPSEEVAVEGVPLKFDVTGSFKTLK